MAIKPLTISSFFDIMLFISIGMRIFGIDKLVPMEVNLAIGIILIVTFILFIISLFRPKTVTVVTQ